MAIRSTKTVIALAFVTAALSSFTPAWALSAQEAKLLPADGAALDAFGFPVAVQGDTAVIGATGAGDNGAQSGAAYVFTRSSGIWTEQQKLLPADGEAKDTFGARVALDGDTVVIGADGDDDNGTVSGSAYVFTRSNGIWTEQQKLLAADGDDFDAFGWSVAVDGDTAMIGAVGDGDGTLFLQGSAYVFTRSGGVWTEQQKLVAADGERGDWFGYSLAVDGDTAMIGASEDQDNGFLSGSVYVFTRSNGIWTEQQKLVPADGDERDLFGRSVALDGDSALIGADKDEDNGPDSGSAYVFARSNGLWTEQQKLLAGDGDSDDRFGLSVALDGDTAMIGAPLNDDNGSNSGSAYVFTRSNGIWTEREKLLAADGAADDGIGYSVAVDGDTGMIGAARDDDNGIDSGSAYVFSLAPPDPVDLLNDLIEQLAGMGLHHGIENSLNAKLSAALIVLTGLAEGNDHAAVNMLGAFVNAVEAQRGKRISEAEAETLITAAQEIMDLLVTGE